jgi:hypothetical protein
MKSIIDRLDNAPITNKNELKQITENYFTKKVQQPR